MADWKQVLAASITKPKDLAAHLGVDPKEIEDVVGIQDSVLTETGEILEYLESQSGKS